MVTLNIRKITEHIKERIKLLYILPTYPKMLKQYKTCARRKIILIGTPAHGNLGDQAIAISEINFINDYKHDEALFEIPTPLYKTHRKFLRQHSTMSDLIIISGGGWMGNLWVHNELMIRNIIEDYPKNRIIIFPQTLYYTNDDNGRMVAQNTKVIFQNHKNLFLTVRDNNSYRAAQDLLGFESDRLLFCPDVVLYGTLANVNLVKEKKKIALICMRQDIEKAVDITDIESAVQGMGYVPKKTTTVYTHLIKVKDREKCVRNLINQYGEADLMITDRLHAMVFSLLAGIPCYVFNNRTAKVFGVASYLRKANMPVEMLEDTDDLNLDTFNLIGKTYKIDNELKESFQQLGSLLSIEGDDYLESKKNDCN